MQLTPATSTPATTGSGSVPTQASAQSSKTVSTQDFMQLLSTEMANQDPMQPMDPTQTMTQLAQFSSLQQATSLAQTQGLATGNSFLGTQVTLPGVNGAPPVTGTVTAIDSSAVASGGSPLLVVSGTTQEYPITSVSQVTIPSSATGASGAAAATATSSSAAASVPTAAGASLSARAIAAQALSQALQ
jgi:flagellar basal-body rod modification protein FlgD